MKKILLSLLLPIFFSCSAQMGALTPEMKTYMAELNTQNVPFMIVNFVSDAPNSAGGVSVYTVPRITSPKTIKYVNFTVEPYNAVGDIQSGQIRNESKMTLEKVGPFTFGDKVTLWGWDNVWYNQTITCVELLSVDVEYMDGSKETYKGDTLSKVLAPEIFRTKERWFCEDPFTG